MRVVSELLLKQGKNILVESSNLDNGGEKKTGFILGKNFESLDWLFDVDDIFCQSLDIIFLSLNEQKDIDASIFIEFPNPFLNIIDCNNQSNFRQKSTNDVFFRCC